MSTNPYEASSLPNSPYEPPEPVDNKPVSIIVFGILNLVFAVLGLFGAVASIGFLVFAFNTQGQQNSPWDAVWSQNAGQAAYMMGSSILNFIFRVVQLFAGIGLLRSRKSGHTLSIIYAWYAIASAIAGVIISYLLILSPAMGQMQQSNSMNGGMFIIFSIVTTVPEFGFPRTAADLHVPPQRGGGIEIGGELPI